MKNAVGEAVSAYREKLAWLHYDVSKEVLICNLPKTALTMPAVSGGGRSNKWIAKAPEHNMASYDPRRATSQNVRGGPLPPGKWLAMSPESSSYFGHEVCRLVPSKAVKASYPEREYGFPGGFYIHAAGPKGSDGCIVITTGASRQKLLEALKEYGGPVLLFVHFGSAVNPDAFREALLQGYTA